MSHRNMVWTHQVVNPESEERLVQVEPGSFYYGGTGSSSSNLGVQVAIRAPGTAANVSIYDPRNYYESIHRELQHVQNTYPHVGVTSSLVFPTAIYNPSMSTTAVNIYIPQTQSFGFGNLPPPSLYHQVGTETMDESSSSSDNFGDSASGLIKRKNAVGVGNHPFRHGFASSCSSAHVPQTPAHGPWNASFQSNCLPNSGYPRGNDWPFLEGSSADGLNTMAAHQEFVRHGNFVFPACHMGQCNTWIAQAASGIAHGVPQWGYSNAVANPPDVAIHPGTTDVPNGNLQDYQAGHSIHGSLPHFCQNPLNSMQTSQMQVPYQQFLINNVGHGVNPSATGLPLDSRLLSLPFNSDHAFGHPVHPPLRNQVNNGVLRIRPYQNAVVMDRARIYGAGHVTDEHRDMRLDVDNMTYEELVALEEQIGVVNTGLTESYIQENLRSSLYIPGAACMSDQSSEVSVENDACIICQEVYEAKDLIGSLECGHKYHVMCIKQWLMMKNLCPICKTTALSVDRRNG